MASSSISVYRVNDQDLSHAYFRATVALRSIDAAPVHLTQGANEPGSQYATWQDVAPNDPQAACGAGLPVASRRSTWGAVKSLYR